MTEQTEPRELRAAIEAALGEQAGAERYRRSQRQARSGRADPPDRPRPLEFDAAGFPVPQHNSGFVKRVARLLGPG
jgi:hypothetical protein